MASACQCTGRVLSYGPYPDATGSPLFRGIFEDGFSFSNLQLMNEASPSLLRTRDCASALGAM